MTARALMLQGTGSSVGKSLLVAGLARACLRRGLAVRPFKPQNMSNNAAVTADGGEIGRAQALQARAAGVAPSVHMNPVLLKPQSETGSQVVVQGRVFATARAREYQALKPALMPRVLDSFERLRAEADVVLVEGAGSPAEVNLRPRDIVTRRALESITLDDKYTLERGRAFMSGVQALVRLPMLQRQRDAADERRVRGHVHGVIGVIPLPLHHGDHHRPHRRHVRHRRPGDAPEQRAGHHVRHAQAAPDVADHAARRRHDFVGDAAVEHQLAAEHEERDRQERKHVHPRHHLLEQDGDRQPFVQDGAQGGEADGEGDGDAERQEPEKGRTQDDQCHDGSTSAPLSRAMMCSTEKETISTPEMTRGA